jgi:three-Cys-motif partner protein
MTKSSIWIKDPHTDAKHLILEEYLKAWFPILSRYNRRIVYIDGFAGPGIYEKGEFGSPIIALRCLLEHSLELFKRPTEFNFLFIESDAQRTKILEETIRELFPRLPENVKIQIKHEEFERSMFELLSTIEEKGSNLAPTFAFIDPFGYSGLPLEMIRRILGYPHCEVFINFAYNAINRFIETQDSREEIFDRLFGSTDWRRIRELGDPDLRNNELTRLYTNQLKTAAKYVRFFEMINNTGNIVYYLYFATNNIKGFSEMKRAMWSADPRGSFRFADTTDVGQRFLLSFEENARDRDQAAIIYTQFMGQTVSREQVDLYCIEHTAFPRLWSKSLRILEDQGLISVTNRTRRGTYPEKCLISFKNRRNGSQ